MTDDEDALELDEKSLKRRRGRRRKGRAVGRYSMAVSVTGGVTQIAVLEGRSLVEHQVSRPSDDVSQIHGNIYIGRVQNVLPGMEAAFIDISTPKNAVLYRGDVQYDPEDIEEKGQARIEQILKNGQTIICQVTKNPIGAKGARLTQEVSLPGRFVVLVPGTSTYGISKRLPDNERKRLRGILDKVKLDGHGVIVRTAAENVTEEEITRDLNRLVEQWRQIEALAKKSKAPALLYREPDMALRVIREEFNPDYRSVTIDDPALADQVRDYVDSVSPGLGERVEYYDPEAEGLPLFERLHIHEQIHKALDRKVWLPSGGSLIIEHTEALTVIDVNTGKNVGKSSLEETVFVNNLEAAEEIARQLRLRDIGGIIVIDFIDMEVKANRAEVGKTFREALSRDKTRTQVFDISELGLVEMTRKRIGEGLMSPCPRPVPPARVGAGSWTSSSSASEHRVRAGRLVAPCTQSSAPAVSSTASPRASASRSSSSATPTPPSSWPPSSSSTATGSSPRPRTWPRPRSRPPSWARPRAPRSPGFTYKNKTNQRKRWGHRQHYSTIEITGITGVPIKGKG